MSEDPAAKPAPEPEPLSIEKPPPGEILARFKTKRSPDERIQTLLPALPHLKISDAKDYVRLHPDDAYWSDEYCFVMVYSDRYDALVSISTMCKFEIKLDPETDTISVCGVSVPTLLEGEEAKTLASGHSRQRVSATGY